MRRTTDEERVLFHAAVSAHAGKRRAKSTTSRVKHHVRKKAAPDKEPAPPREEPVKDGKRRATREERELFQAAVSGAALVKKARSAPKEKPAAKPVTPPAPPAGLDGNTGRRLARGEIAPDTKLDLHGLTEAAAHRALTSLVLAAHKRGERLLLVVTGKGGVSPDPDRPRGVLRALVPRWLAEAPLAALIAEKRAAHRRHGGEGALYVYLRKVKR